MWFPGTIGLHLTTLIFAGSAWTIAAQPLVLNNTAEAPYTREDGSGMLNRIAQEAFRRAGLQLTLIRLPPERGLRAANDGLVDGELVRIAGLSAAYPNLIQVPETHSTRHFQAFTKRDAVTTGHWRELAPYSVGIIKGWKILEDHLTGVRELATANDVHQLFRMLAHNRVDVVVYTRYAGMHHVNIMKIGNIRRVEPPLASREMFFYLNKKHAALAPKLATALRDMKKDGTLAGIVKQAMPAGDTQ